MRRISGAAYTLVLLSASLTVAQSSGAQGRSLEAGSVQERAPFRAEQNLPPLKVEVDKTKVDLERHRLEVRMSRDAKSVKIKVLGESGSVLADEEQDFSGAPAGKALNVTWHPSSDEKVARIEVYGYDTYGYYAGVAITPWNVFVPHQEVNFETDKAIIRDSEKPKLEDSYKKITKALEKHKEIGAISLFIAGHTDTVGTAAHNQELSRRRAQAIAHWFKARGIRIPVFWQGFGESALLVKTQDEVDEPRNRRVDYILSIDPPRFKVSGNAASWNGTK